MIAAAGLLVPAAAVAQQGSSPATPGIVIKLAWKDPIPNLDGAEFDSAMGPVRLDKAAITNFSVALVPCGETSRNTRAPAALHAVLGIGRAQAGHGGTPSPFQLVHSAAETIGVGETWTFGTINLPDIEYCAAHYLAVRAFSGSRAIETHPEVRGLTLALDGGVRGGGGKWTRFRILTPEAYGRVIPLTTNEGKPFRGRLPNGAVLTLIRDFRFIFRELDVSRRGAKTARQILRNLMEHTVAEVVAGG